MNANHTEIDGEIAGLPPLVPTPHLEEMLRGVVSRNTLHAWLRKGKIQSVQPAGRNGRRYIPRAEVERLLNGGRRHRSHLLAHHACGESLDTGGVGGTN